MSSAPAPLALHEIKGMLTKFMRMLFPLEFRIDSLTNFGAALPFRYPLLSGEVIYLPEKVTAFEDDREASMAYYRVIAAHLAARHDFGSFTLKLCELPGFEERGESGVEAIHAYVSSFEDSNLAGALLRLCEAARIDAALGRRYRGLTGQIAMLNRNLAARSPARTLGTMLIRAALDIETEASDSSQGFVDLAAEFFTPLRDARATVRDSAIQMASLYQWFHRMLEAARMAAEGAESLESTGELDDLTSTLADGADGASGADDEGQISPQDGDEPNQNVQLQLSGKRGAGGQGQALSPEELQRLLEQGAQLRPSEAEGAGSHGQGMYLTQLKGKQSKELQELYDQLAEAGSVSSHGRLVLGARSGPQDSYFAYDEWDYVMGDYRRSWCRLREIPLTGDHGDFYARTLERYSDLLPQVRRHFQRIRPASYKMVRGLEDGEDFDLDRAIEARVQRWIGESPDSRLYKARKKEARDVATLFLLDMSASTDEPIQREVRRHTADDDADDWLKAWQRKPAMSERPRRIIDVNKEALVIMAQALEELGDAYAIMGFSGHGRDNVEFYVIKEFGRELSDEVKARVGAVEPKRSTRMGTAIRHVREKFKDVGSRSKHVILLSDGFPQDFDYGQDRRSNVYGIQDTMVALKELEMAGVTPFCITVDRTGHDYLRQMCQSSRYLVIEDIAQLPRELPKIYEQIVRW
jgi:hypothetical protein